MEKKWTQSWEDGTTGQNTGVSDLGNNLFTVVQISTEFVNHRSLMNPE